jgi:ubiquinone/menaquinone biosynthesis C-methylase UbiE
MVLPRTPNIAMSSIVPRNVLPRSASLVTYISGDITEKIAVKLLRLLPPIDAGSSIHDNACGSGAITKAIMSSVLPPGCKLYATDINPAMVSELQAEASAKGWPVIVEIMAAQRLNFANEAFSHSINSFSIHLIEEDDEVMKQVHRTLKPGGVALFSIWRYPILARAVLAAHYATRPAGTPPLPALERANFGVEALRQLLKSSNFGSDTLTWSEVEEFMLINNLRQWLIAAWSLLGQPAQGWAQQDEDNWDKAIAVMMQTVEAWEGYETLAGGAVKLSMVADVVIAVKAGL